MGSSISPQTANTALGECERTAYANKAKAKRCRFVVGDEEPAEVVRGRRLADDITFASRVLCPDCLYEWAKLVYRGLKWEAEEKGRKTVMCDRRLELKWRIMKQGQNETVSEEFLRATRHDKNTEYVQGAAESPNRVRFQPWPGHVQKQEAQSWVVGR